MYNSVRSGPSATPETCATGVAYNLTDATVQTRTYGLGWTLVDALK